MNFYNSNPQSPKTPKRNPKLIEVYTDNFIQEIKNLSSHLEQYNYIGMDTEFPGIVYKLDAYSNDFYYKSIRKNVNNLKIIQLGITLSNSKGEHPQNIITWQFNFHFDISVDKFSNESISLLINSGINFNLLKTKGIPHNLFAEYFITSGLLLDQNIHWISYHGVSDFAYLLKLALNCNLPNEEKDFIDLLQFYFPSFYDIRILVHEKEQYKGGLNKLIQYLDIERNGDMHQAGSDSLVTSDAFFNLINKGIISFDELKLCENILYGIGEGEDNNETISYVSFENNVNITNNNVNNNNNRNNINNVIDNNNNIQNNILYQNTQTALNINTPIYIPNMTYSKNNGVNNNGNYTIMNPVMMNNGGNNMMFRFNQNYVS